MTDIVERLRDGVNRFYGNEPTGLMNEAADEIERLREALQKIASKNPFHNQCPPAGDTNYYGKLIAEMVVIARDALKEKE